MTETLEKPRFDFNASTIQEATDYINNRAKQLLRFGYRLKFTQDFEWGVSAFFIKDGKPYQALYILEQYRNKGIYKKNIIYPILTSVECKIADYLTKNNISHVVEEIESFDEYKIISNYYGNKTTKRTGVHLMNHIDEGLAILEWIRASKNAMKAYCLHPIYQSDTELRLNTWKYDIETPVLINAIEYRSVANEYLSTRFIGGIDEIRLSPLIDVNDMLIADKIQNRKDFELYHKATHPRSEELAHYFYNWFARLGISEETYQDMKKRLK